MGPGPAAPPPDLRAAADAGGLRVARGGPRDAVVEVVLARPEVRNAQTPATWAALRAVGDWLPDDVRVVVVRGEGAGFSAGLDRAVLTGPLRADPPDEDAIAGFQAAFTWQRTVPAVTVAAVQGAAVGAGFQLALACDLRVCATDARFAMRETSLGLVPDLGGTAVLVELVGYARALELCATGRWLDAEEAHAVGLALRPVPPDALGEAVDELVEGLLAAPPAALRETKALLAGAGGRSAAEQRAAERAAQARLLRESTSARTVLSAP